MDEDVRGVTGSIFQLRPLRAERARGAIPYVSAGISTMLFGAAVLVAVAGAMAGGELWMLIVGVAAVVSGLVLVAGSQLIGERAPVPVAALAAVILCAGVGAVALGVSAPRVYALTAMDEVTVTVLDRGGRLPPEYGRQAKAGLHVHEVRAPDGEVGYIELPAMERVNGEVEGVLQDPRGLRGLTMPPDAGATAWGVAGGALATAGFALTVLHLTRRAARSLLTGTPRPRPAGT
jgi:hypothetical protein